MLLSRVKVSSNRAQSSKDKGVKLPSLDEFLARRDFLGAMTFLEFQSQLMNQNSVESLLWYGYAAFHAGEYRKGADTYLQILKNYPTIDPIVNGYLAICYFFLGLIEEARQYVEKTPSSRLIIRLLFHLSQKEQDESTLMTYHQKLQDVLEDQLTLASIHYLRTHYQEAIDIYKKIMLEHREYAAINVYVALCYYRLEYFDVSQDILNVYLQQYPDSFISLNLKACNYYRLYNGKAAEDELKPLIDNLQEKNHYFADEVLRHNLVVFRGGQNAIQVLPHLIGVVPEAVLNLVIFHLKNGDTVAAYDLLKDLEPSSPNEFILKGIVNAALGQEQNSKEHIKIAQQYFQLVGSSASECDTIPGRQAMASYFILLKQFDDVMIYLNSVKAYFENDDAFNYNFGQTKFALKEYAEAEAAFLLVHNEKMKSEYVYQAHLTKCYIQNQNAAKAWELFLKMETSSESFQLLQIIAHDAFATKQYLYAAKAFDALDQLDPSTEHYEGKRASCLGAFRQIINNEIGHEAIRELITIMTETAHPELDHIVGVMKKWCVENGFDLALS